MTIVTDHPRTAKPIAAAVIWDGGGLTLPQARRFVRSLSHDDYRAALAMVGWSSEWGDGWRIAAGDLCSPDGSAPWEVDEIFDAAPGLSLADTRRRERRRRSNLVLADLRQNLNPGES